MNAQKIKIKSVDLFEREVKLRLPFRFGVVTLQQAPQAFVRVSIEFPDGKYAVGNSAELMVPKWFDKDTSLSNEDNFNQLRLALTHAGEAYLSSAPRTAFELYCDHYQELIDRGTTDNLNPLVVGYGPALLDRAIVDAICRRHDISFYQLVNENLTGLTNHPLISDLDNFDLQVFLRNLQPVKKINARHTIGMIDPLTSDDQEADSRCNDGLPETLEEVIHAYGNRYFKIKVGGNVEQDIQRFLKIAATLSSLDDPYYLSVDGNEQYSNIDEFAELMRALQLEHGLQRFRDSILFIEQPIRRQQALSASVVTESFNYPVIIDESDNALEAFILARGLGYRGISSKSCKGIYKSLVNAARCVSWNQTDDTGGYFMSAEDLTCQSGLSVQQDLALVAILGLSHVERNGHHYVFGMAGASTEEQLQFMDGHRDLYRLVDEQVCLQINKGELNLESLNQGFGTQVMPDINNMRRMPDIASALIQ